MATSRVYTLFQIINPEETAISRKRTKQDDKRRVITITTDKDSGEAVIEDKRQAGGQVENRRKTSRDLFNAHGTRSTTKKANPTTLQGAEAWSQNDEMPEQPLEAGDVAFAYDEWDRDLNGLSNRLEPCG